MSRSLLSIIIALMIGGGAGFLTGAYVVPTGQAIQFRALVDRSVGAVAKAFRPGDVGAGGPPPAPPAQETSDAPAAPRIGADFVCAPGSANCAPLVHPGAAAPTDAPQTESAKPENAQAPAAHHGKTHAGRDDAARPPGTKTHQHRPATRRSDN